MWTSSRFVFSRIPAVYVCGLNYVTHAREVGMLDSIGKFPTLAMKNPSAVVAQPTSAEAENANVKKPCEIQVPPFLQDPKQVDYEGEMAFVFRKTCTNVSESDAGGVLGGITCALDVTARRWQSPKRGGSQWCYCKSFTTFCPISSTLWTPPQGDYSSTGALSDVAISTTLNGEEVQRDKLGSLCFGIPQLVAFLTAGTTIEENTVVLTGTPSGVGFTRDPPRYLVDGDKLAVQLQMPQQGQVAREVLEANVNYMKS